MLEPDVCWYYYVYLVSQTITMHFKVLLHTRGQTCGKHVVYGCQFFLCELFYISKTEVFASCCSFYSTQLSDTVMQEVCFNFETNEIE